MFLIYKLCKNIDNDINNNYNNNFIESSYEPDLS